MSQQRVHVPRCLASLHGVRTGVCSPGSTVLSRHCDFLPHFPPHFVSFAWRYHGCAGPVSSLPPPPSAKRRAWGWSPGIPVREFFRGDDRISQVPGEPQFPFAHGLRPRPAETSLTYRGTLAWPPVQAQRRRRRQQNFRGSIAWLSGWLPTYYDVGYPSPHKARFQVLVRLSWTGFHPQGSDKRFSTHVMCVGLLFQASWHNPLYPPPFPLLAS
jgi:hypothetical protein